MIKLCILLVSLFVSLSSFGFNIYNATDQYIDVVGPNYQEDNIPPGAVSNGWNYDSLINLRVYYVIPGTNKSPGYRTDYVYEAYKDVSPHKQLVVVGSCGGAYIDSGITEMHCRSGNDAVTLLVT